MESVDQTLLYPLKLVVVLSIMIFFLFIVLVWAVICSYRIFAKFRFQEKILALSTLCVVISSASAILTLVIEIIEFIELSQGINTHAVLMF
jgi:multisubunit Na+/H+ antiporter MnhF subunit